MPGNKRITAFAMLVIAAAIMILVPKSDGKNYYKGKRAGGCFHGCLYDNDLSSGGFAKRHGADLYRYHKK